MAAVTTDLVVMFEGGLPVTELDRCIAGVRKAVALDTLEMILGLRPYYTGLDVVLVTNYPDLAAAATAMGAQVEQSIAESFHFGDTLNAVIRKYRPQAVLYMSGAAAPLVRAADIAGVLDVLNQGSMVVMVNNVQSPDIVGFSPAENLVYLPPVASDNCLGQALREAGYTRVLIPNSARINFDLDTPVDIQILGLHEDAGERTKAEISNLAWDTTRLNKARKTLMTPYCEVLLSGRVGPSVMAYINSNCQWRLRVISEERGMKALGRDKTGQVVSIAGIILEQLGIDGFFQMIARVCQVAFIDTRVIFAHMHRNLSDWDRFNSDLGNYDVVADDFAREFTKKAVNADIPVILGGHSLVSGGIWLLADEVAQRQRGEHYEGYRGS